MARNSLITEGFASNNVSLITEGWADLQEIAIVGAGTLIINGQAISQRIIEDYIAGGAAGIGGPIYISGTTIPNIFELSYNAIGEISINGVSESAIEFSYNPIGEELLLYGNAVTERIVGNVYYPSGELITISGISQTIATDYKYSTTATGQIVVNGTIESTIEFSYIPSGEELFIDGISRTLFSTETEYLSSGKIELNGLSLTELASVNFFVSPTGQILNINGEGSTFIHDLHYYFDPISGKIIITGLANTKFSKFLEFLKPEETEEIFNYATGLTNPEYQKEIRGGRAAPLVAGISYEDILKTDPGCNEILQRERIISALAFSSKDKIKGVPNFTDMTMSKLDFNSKSNIRGSGNYNTRNMTKTDFNSKNKVKGKRTGRDGTYNYKDDMFKQ